MGAELVEEEEEKDLTPTRPRRRVAKAQRKEAEVLEKAVSKYNNYWSAEEHQRFADAVRFYGKGWQRITDIVGTRTKSQVMEHGYMLKKRIEKNPDHEDFDILMILFPSKMIVSQNAPQECY